MLLKELPSKELPRTRPHKTFSLNFIVYFPAQESSCYNQTNVKKKCRAARESTTNTFA